MTAVSIHPHQRNIYHSLARLSHLYMITSWKIAPNFFSSDGDRRMHFTCNNSNNNMAKQLRYCVGLIWVGIRRTMPEWQNGRMAEWQNGGDCHQSENNDAAHSKQASKANKQAHLSIQHIQACGFEPQLVDPRRLSLLVGGSEQQFHEVVAVVLERVLSV